MRAASNNPSRDDTDPPVTKEIMAEAAVWIAMLHGPNRSPKMERDFREWQASSAAHRKAFERTTDVWEMVPRIRVQDAFAGVSSSRAASGFDADGGGYGLKRRRRRWPLLMLLPVTVVTALVFVRTSTGGTDYATKVGEQQLVVLDDGSRMTLNTNTQVHVSLGKTLRSVEVKQGEALFEVAKDSQRPFVVHAGGTEVEAVGTVFSVRVADGGDRRADALAVALVEGQVAVRPDPSAWTKGLSSATPILMKAGERLKLVKAAPATATQDSQQLDRPRMDSLLAWKRSEADFDDVPLPDAVNEMNRYSRTPITLLDTGALAALRVSGQFHTGDNLSFARTISALHRLKLTERDGRLELSLPH